MSSFLHSISFPSPLSTACYFPYTHTRSLLTSVSVADRPGVSLCERRVIASNCLLLQTETCHFQQHTMQLWAYVCVCVALVVLVDKGYLGGSRWVRIGSFKHHHYHFLLHSSLFYITFVCLFDCIQHILHSFLPASSAGYCLKFLSFGTCFNTLL